MDCTTSGADAAYYEMKSARQGDSWTGPTFILTKNTVPLDLTGVLVEMGFRLNGKQGQLKLLLSSDKGDFTISSNSITINERPLTLLPGKYTYDLQLTFPAAEPRVKTYLEGHFVVTQDVTPSV